MKTKQNAKVASVFISQPMRLWWELAGRCVWVFLLFGSWALATGPKVLLLDGSQAVHSLNAYSYHYHDVSGKADYATVKNADYLFESSATRFSSHGFSDGVLWLKFTLGNSLAYDQTWVVEVGNPLLDEVIFFTADSPNQEPIVTGDAFPVASRPELTRTYNFPITLPSGMQRTYFVSVRTQGSLQAPLYLRTRGVFEEFKRRETVLFCLYFGMVLALLLYNAFLAIPLRRMGYPCYVFYIASHFLAQLAFTGMAPLFLWPSHPWWTNRALPILVTMATFCGMQFTFKFLNTQALLPRLYYWISRINPIWAALGIALSLFSSYRISAVYVLCFLLFWCAFALAIGVYSLIRKKRQAVFYLLGWGGFLVGVLVNIFRVLGLDISLETATAAMLGGATAELLILSLGLADQINIIAREKAQVVKRLASQNDILRHENTERRKAESALMETRQELENQVIERTKDLANVNKSLLKEIEDHKVTEVQLVAAHQRAEEESLAKSRFLANMSHEIRTPLNAIVGLSELLLDETQEELEDGKRQHYLENIYRSGHHLSQVINQILDLSKIEAGKMDLSMEVVRLPVLVRDVFEVCFQQAQAKGVKLSYRYSDELPEWIQTDHTALRRILLNLVGNAIKFTKEHKRVDLEVSFSEAELIFNVKDQGIGISLARREAIFNAFEQADNTTTREFGGTGLGLAISQKLTQLLGGQIHLSSEEGKGSCFTVTLPLKICDPPVAGGAPKDDSAIRFDPNCVVLVAEDNITNMFVLRALLARVGLSVHHAENGQEAVVMAKELVPDLILMDMHMPVMDGLQATKQIRLQEGTETIPVVAITADAFKEKKAFALSHGLDDYLVKPINFPELVQVLSRFLKKASGNPTEEKIADPQTS